MPGRPLSFMMWLFCGLVNNIHVCLMEIKKRSRINLIVRFLILKVVYLLELYPLTLKAKFLKNKILKIFNIYNKSIQFILTTKLQLKEQTFIIEFG